MSFSIHDVNAYITGEKNGVYALKMEIHDLGIYVNGMTARQSKKFDGWWLQPPVKKLPSGKYVKDVEFSSKTELWDAMLRAAIDAINEHRRPYGDL